MHGPKEPSSTPWPCPSTILIPWGSSRPSSIARCQCPACPQRGARAPGSTSSRAESEGSSLPAFPGILPLLVLQPLPLCGEKPGKSRAPIAPQLPTALPQGQEKTTAAQGEAPRARAHPEPPAASCARRPAGQGSGGCAPPGRRSPGAVPGRPTFRGAPWPAAGSLGESRGGRQRGHPRRGLARPPAQPGNQDEGAQCAAGAPTSPLTSIGPGLGFGRPGALGQRASLHHQVLGAEGVACCGEGGALPGSPARPRGTAEPRGAPRRCQEGTSPLCPPTEHPAGCYLLWGWRRCPGRAYRPPT